jgi:uroporphyrinogen III methyltransferase/synthase
MIAPLVGVESILTKKLKDIKGYSWLVFTSEAGVDIFFDYLIDNKIDIRELSHLKIACVGMETERAVVRRGIMVNYTPAEYNGAALAEGLTGLVKKGERIFIARAKDGDTDLTRILTDVGVDFDDVPVYERIKYTKNACAAVISNDFDFVAFTSPSGVEGFAEAVRGIDLGKIKAVCIGEKTAGVARAYGMNVYVSAEATIRGMVEKIKELSV